MDLFFHGMLPGSFLRRTEDSNETIKFELLKGAVKEAPDIYRYVRELDAWWHLVQVQTGMELFVKKGRDDMEDRYSLVVNALCMARGVMREGKKTTPDLEKDAARAIDAIGFALTYSGISGGLTVADIEKIAVAWVDRMSANSFIEDRHYLDRYAVPRDKRSLAMILRVALAMKGMDAVLNVSDRDWETSTDP